MNGRTFKVLERLGTGELVALDDLTRMETHDEEVLGALEELAGEDDHGVRRVAHLRRFGQIAWSTTWVGHVPRLLVPERRERGAWRRDVRPRPRG
jgi:hypothetical protein